MRWLLLAVLLGGCHAPRLSSVCVEYQEPLVDFTGQLTPRRLQVDLDEWDVLEFVRTHQRVTYCGRTERLLPY